MYLSDIFTISVNLAGLPGAVAALRLRRAAACRSACRSIGRPFDEATRAATSAHAYEQATDWHRRQPAAIAAATRAALRRHRMDFEAVIGLEVHAELLTRVEDLLRLLGRVRRAAERATPARVCLGMPGVLPVLNRRVVEFAIRAGLATALHDRAASAAARARTTSTPTCPRAIRSASTSCRSASAAASTSWSTARRSAVAPDPHPHGGGHRQEHPRRARRRQPGRLQPLRRAAARDRQRARHPLARRGRRLPAHAARRSSSTSRSATATWRKAASAATPTSRCGRAARPRSAPRPRSRT